MRLPLQEARESNRPRQDQALDSIAFIPPPSFVQSSIISPPAASSRPSSLFSSCLPRPHSLAGTREELSRPVRGSYSSAHRNAPPLSHAAPARQARTETSLDSHPTGGPQPIKPLASASLGKQPHGDAISRGDSPGPGKVDFLE
jgi:hypothetical protein